MAVVSIVARRPGKGRRELWRNAEMIYYSINSVRWIVRSDV